MKSLLLNIAMLCLLTSYNPVFANPDLTDKNQEALQVRNLEIERSNNFWVYLINTRKTNRFDTYLPLTGGTLSGQVRVDLNTTGSSLIGTGGGSNFHVAHDASSTVNLINSAGGGFSLNGSLTGISATFSQSSGIGMTIRSDWDASATNNSQLYLTGSSNTDQQLRLGYATHANYGYIQALVSGTNVQNLVLNPSGGNVGVGTTNPGGPLHISKLGVNPNEIGGSVILERYRDANWYAGAIFNYVPSGGHESLAFALSEGSTNPLDLSKIKMSINSIGNVGIGTNIPGQPLHIRSISTTLPKLKVTDGGLSTWLGTGQGYDNPIIAYGDVGGVVEAANPVNTRYGWSISSVYNGDFNIGRKADNSVWSDAFAIQRATGNVGIGTTSPGSKLHIQANANTSGAPNNSQFVITGETSPEKKLSLAYNTSSNYAELQSQAYSGGYTPIVFNPNGGDVAIGTTDPKGLIRIS